MRKRSIRQLLLTGAHKLASPGRATLAKCFPKFFLNATKYVHPLACPWTIEREDNREYHENLCRDLCRNLSIPTRVACSHVMSRVQVKGSEQRPNTLEHYPFMLFGLLRCRVLSDRVENSQR
jgi:hypothetical protein